MPEIISRQKWGATPWRGQPYSVAMSERAWFLVHYHGGPPRNDRGNANAKEIEAIHLNNGWSGVGYNFIVGQDGAIREGRGWGLVGAHCPGHNRDGIGVYVAVGGDQKPTPEALASVRWLYDEACRKAGRTLVKSYHGFDYPTSCPGPNLRAWVIAGMGVKAASKPASSPSKPKPAPSKPAAKPSGSLLRRGSKGAAVRRLQSGLRETFPAYAGRLSVDGDFGPATERVVREFQTRSGLRADGVVGPATRAALAKHGVRL